MGRKRRKGVLTAIRSTSKSSKKKRETMPRKLAGWIGGSLALIVMIGIAGLLLWRIVSPVELAEGTFEVTRVEELESPEASEADPDVEYVAEAFAVIGGKEMFFKLTAEQLESVRAGGRIHAKFKLYSLSRSRPVVVEEWEVVEAGQEPPPPASSEEPG
jgi:hypothetical protein